MDNGRMVRVSSKGQIVLPKKFREEMGVGEGDYLLVRAFGKGTMILQTREESPLWKQLEPLRRDAQAQGFTPEELDDLIHTIRAERKSDAA